MFDSQMLAFWSPGPAEMMVLAVVALLLYGGDLPEMARSWGKSFAEFRRGLSGFQNELNDVIYSQPEQLTYEESRRGDSYSSGGYEESDGESGYEESEFVSARQTEPNDNESVTDKSNQDTLVDIVETDPEDKNP